MMDGRIGKYVFSSFAEKGGRVPDIGLRLQAGCSRSTFACE
jgi:hypothetical protein